jgi:hypothetical protein
LTKFGVVFLVLLLGPGAIAAARPSPDHETRQLAPTVVANQRLTAVTGVSLVFLLAAIAVTILFIRQLLAEHYIVGFLLIPPLLLKVAATGYRFGRYYTGSQPYRRAGPPPILLRVGVAPVLLASTVAVVATGLELWLFGLRFGDSWMTAHTLSAVVFVIAVGLHLVGHFRRSAVAAVEEVVTPPTREALTRRSLVVASLLLGLALALASLFYTTPFPAAAAGG